MEEAVISVVDAIVVRQRQPDGPCGFHLASAHASASGLHLFFEAPGVMPITIQVVPTRRLLGYTAALCIADEGWACTWQPTR